jgi:hypothetical protein
LIGVAYIFSQQSTLQLPEAPLRSARPLGFIREGSYYGYNQRDLLVISGDVISKFVSFITKKSFTACIVIAGNF